MTDQTEDRLDEPVCSCTSSLWRIDDRPGGARLRDPDPDCPVHQGR